MRSGFALAAKAVIVNGDKVLLLKRSENEMKTSLLYKNEAWDLPGGSIRFHENCTEGLLREITEETSVKVKIVKPLGIFDVIKNQLHMTICTYLCIYKGGEVLLSDEHDAYFWLSIDDAEEMSVPRWILKDMKRAISEL
ncbi:hypothetical protein SDC9_111799 [bioreactor metagenome]|uniref:Nudix hydrolase domain-containing protein n=1 Tax=bioreactor metagenome TaxID=1076179 RepID=A0A645BIK1_9ZZZZ|nr:NUDIX domain-containing protein [Candidatus Metalachnospira sp.]